MLIFFARPLRLLASGGELHALDDACRRSALYVWERDDATARPLDLLAPVYLFEGVVAALREHVRQDFADESARRLLVEDRHEVNGRECGEKFRALALIHHGPPRAFERAHRAVAVYCDEQRVAQTPRRFEVSNVSDVQNVEAPVREDEPAPLGAQTRAHAQQLLTVENHSAAHPFVNPKS